MMMSREVFLQTVAAAVGEFPTNAMCRRVDGGDFALADYHALLRMLFHQTFEGRAPSRWRPRTVRRGSSSPATTCCTTPTRRRPTGSG